MLKRVLFTGFGALAVCLAGCATSRSPLVSVPQPPPVPAVSITRFSALSRLSPAEIPMFEDDMDTASLHAAAWQSFLYYQNLPENQLFVLGSDTYTAKDLAGSMADLMNLLETSKTKKDWIQPFQDSFTAYQSVGADANKTVVFSSYYEPTIEARLAPGGIYKFPLYARPPDLVDVDLSLFDSAYQGAHISGQRQGNKLVPYPTRSDIDTDGILKGQGLEIAWAKDPMDILDLQIEGSGWLHLGKGNVKRIRYDGDNGRRYHSVGQYLIATGRIPAKSFSRKKFLRYLAAHPQERQEFLNADERYIFFRIDTSTSGVYAYGNIDEPLTAGRSIATDPKLFPKGALAWITVNGIHRFVLNQDEGGAIKGSGRVDVFAGHGDKAKKFATHFWNPGLLYFLVKKKS